MKPPEVSRAVAAATTIASALGLTVADAILLHNSNKLTLNLVPCDVVARVAPIAHQVAAAPEQLLHGEPHPGNLRAMLAGTT